MVYIYIYIPSFSFESSSSRSLAPDFHASFVQCWSFNQLEDQCHIIGCWPMAVKPGEGRLMGFGGAFADGFYTKKHTKSGKGLDV